MTTTWDAHAWVRNQLPKRMRPLRLGGISCGTRFAPTTADLRTLLHARTTPRFVRNYLYTCLRLRRLLRRTR